MRKLLIMLLGLSLLCSCGISTNHAFSSESYKEIAHNHILEEVKTDNFVVYEDYNITVGQAIWDEFLEGVEKGNSCEIRLLFYNTMKGQGITPEHEQYEDIKDDYPLIYIQDLHFDGMNYTLYWVDEEKEYSREYEFLKKHEDSLAIRYFLVHDNSVTWEQVIRSMFSSQSGDFIEWETVYQKKH